jgi:glycosyltransferase involved in cell wall biosynthesis
VADHRSLRLFAFHENVESVAAVLNALSTRIEVHAFRVVSPGWYLRARRPLQGGFYWDEVSEAEHQQLAVVPGLRKLARLSSWMLRRKDRAAVRRHGEPDFVLIDSPYLQPLAAAIDVPLLYVAADAYRYYAWPEAEVARLERQIFDQAYASFAVSELLAEDFRASGARNVFQSGTAVGAAFVEAGRLERPEPVDLAVVPRQRVGIVGKINLTYDWDLLEGLIAARPETSFVFFGPNQELDPAGRDRIDRAFSSPNVYWLGAKPHAELPAYLNGCDVLLNPLSVNDHNDRRFPLRLSEYLTTRRPVVTTAVHEAQAFAPHVVVVSERAEALDALDRALAGSSPVDVAGRRQWLERNTWDARAENVLRSIDLVAAGQASE